MIDTISLFAGCGGLDLGVQRAGGTIILANDSDKDAAATHARNFPDTEFVCQDIAELSTLPEGDLVVGGYPCQSFSMGGNRKPSLDDRTQLYTHFGRVLDAVSPKYFIAENVSGLRSLRNGHFLEKQVALFGSAGKEGYRITTRLLDARDYGVPQRRKRVFIVGVRRDLEARFVFPDPTHRKPATSRGRHLDLPPWTSHGEAIKHLPLWPKGEFYERPHDPDGHFSWYYMSRNRKASWDEPSFTIVANWRHITLHPASPTMEMLWSNLADGWKQGWGFSNEYEHLVADPNRPVLETPRRLSWRECAAIQTFPEGFEPAGNVQSKFQQIGNAVPPLLAEAVVRHLISGTGLIDARFGPAEQTEIAL